jgi:hypothetical protein
LRAIRAIGEYEDFASMLGGPDRGIFFICTTPDGNPEKTGIRQGWIEAA